MNRFWLGLDKICQGCKCLDWLGKVFIGFDRVGWVWLGFVFVWIVLSRVGPVLIGFDIF